MTVSFYLVPGTALGDATAKIDRCRDEIRMPASIVTRDGGDAAVFERSQSSQAILLVWALRMIHVLIEGCIGPGRVTGCPRGRGCRSRW